MKLDVGQTLKRLVLFSISGVLLASCQPSNRFHSTPPSAKNTENVVIEDELVPTVSDEDIPVRDGVTYETRQKKIMNPQAEILLGRLKFEKTKMVYDSANRTLNVTGFVNVLDENKKQIATNDFRLSGTHEADNNIFTLKADKVTKANSMEKPVVRAKVTCLSINENEEYDCSKIVIDFFVAFQKQIYSEQLELAKQKNKNSPSETVPPPQKLPVKPESQPPSPSTDNSTSPSVSPAIPDDDEDDTEGVEDSIDGRYQGHAETIDLRDVFADDEAEEHALDQAPTVTPPPPTPVKPTPTTVPQTPPKTEPKPTTPQTPVPTPAPPAEPKKPDTVKDKPLTKDLVQTRTGDVRQVNQSIGFPDKGNLRNSTSVLTKQHSLNESAFFEVVEPARERHYATYEMADMISRLAKSLNQNFNHKLYVGNISQKSGGKIYSMKNGKPVLDRHGNPVLAHASHQIGVDVDLGYPTAQAQTKFPIVVEKKTRQYNSSSYSVSQTYQLLKYAFSQEDIKVDRIFADQTIKKALCEYAKASNELSGRDKDVVTRLFQNIDHVDGHGNHFHLRLKCSTYDPACRTKIYSVNKGCS